MLSVILLSIAKKPLYIRVEMADIYKQAQQYNVIEHIEIQQNDTKYNGIQRINK